MTTPLKSTLPAPAIVPIWFNDTSTTERWLAFAASDFKGYRVQKANRVTEWVRVTIRFHKRVGQAIGDKNIVTICVVELSCGSGDS